MSDTNTTSRGSYGYVGLGHCCAGYVQANDLQEAIWEIIKRAELGENEKIHVSIFQGNEQTRTILSAQARISRLGYVVEYEKDNLGRDVKHDGCRCFEK